MFSLYTERARAERAAQAAHARALTNADWGTEADRLSRRAKTERLARRAVQRAEQWVEACGPQASLIMEDREATKVARTVSLFETAADRTDRAEVLSETARFNETAGQSVPAVPGRLARTLLHFHEPAHATQRSSAGPGQQGGFAGVHRPVTASDKHRDMGGAATSTLRGELPYAQPPPATADYHVSWRHCSRPADQLRAPAGQQQFLATFSVTAPRPAARLAGFDGPHRALARTLSSVSPSDSPAASPASRFAPAAPSGHDRVAAELCPDGRATSPSGLLVVAGSVRRQQELERARTGEGWGQSAPSPGGLPGSAGTTEGGKQYWNTARRIAYARDLPSQSFTSSRAGAATAGDADPDAAVSSPDLPVPPAAGSLASGAATADAGSADWTGPWAVTRAGRGGPRLSAAELETALRLEGPNGRALSGPEYLHRARTLVLDADRLRARLLQMNAAAIAAEDAGRDAAAASSASLDSRPSPFPSSSPSPCPSPPPHSSGRWVGPTKRHALAATIGARTGLALTPRPWNAFGELDETTTLARAIVRVHNGSA